MMVAGSSLEVMPAADLPALAARRGAMLILVNLEPTKYDRIADVTVRGDVADVLPKLVGGLSDRDKSKPTNTPPHGGGVFVG